MHPQKQRLTWKEVMFLTRKRNFIPAWQFGFFYFRQYQNNKFNQISSHITLKLDKRAVHRRKIKRIILQYLDSKDVIHKPINWKYRKIFIILNKNQLDQLQKLIISQDKPKLKQYVLNTFSQSRTRCRLKLPK